MATQISDDFLSNIYRTQYANPAFRAGKRPLSILRFPGSLLNVCLLLAVLLVAGMATPVVARGGKIPNDSFDTALPLDIHGSGLTGSLSEVSDMAYYTFSIDYARDVTIWLQTQTIGSELKAIVALYDGSGRLLAYNDGEFNLKFWAYDGDPILYIRPPAAGKYFIGVGTQAKWISRSAYPWEIPTYTGIFKVNLLSHFDGPAVGDGYESNDSLQAAWAASLPFISGTMNLMYFGDIDWYRFEAKKGTKLSIDIDSLEIGGLPGYDLTASPRLGVFDGRGNLLKSNLDSLDPDTGFAGDPSLVFEVPSDGKYYISVTAAADRHFVTAFRDEDFLKNPYVSSKSHSIGYYQLEVRETEALYFSHIANGVFGETRFSTSIILMNTSNRTARGELQLFKSDGSPMFSEFPPSTKAASSYWFDIPPGGESVITTDGKGAGSAGYAVVQTTTPIVGTAVFSQFDSKGVLVTEAAVEASAGVEYFAFPVDNSGDFNTGLAVANITGTTKASLSMRLVDLAGKTLSTKTMILDPGTQKAIFVGGPGQMFPEIIGVKGSLQVASDQPVYAIALRTTPKTLTTLAPVPMDLPYQPMTLRFPQVVIGGAETSYQTTVLLTNPGYFPVSGTLQFTRADGTPMVVGINSKESGTHSFSIPAHGSAILVSSATNQLVSGYATVEADHGIGGMIVYSQFERTSGRLVTEVAVPSAVPAKKAAVFAQNESGYTTGLAYANLNGSTVALSCQLQPGGNPSDIQKSDLPALEAGKQRAQMIAGPSQIFPTFSGSGVLTLSSALPLYTVALRITASTMTALPVIPLP